MDWIPVVIRVHIKGQVRIVLAPHGQPIRLPFAVNNSTMVHPQEVDIIVAGGGPAGS
jgi:hypothetical protein